MARAKFNFTEDELYRKTKIILFLTDDKKVIYEENKAYWLNFKRRRVLNIGINQPIAPIKHYAVQTLALNSMRSIDIELLPENERAEAILLARKYFKNGLISISNEMFEQLNSETYKEFLQEKNGIDFIIHFNKYKPLAWNEITYFAKATKREIWWAFNSFENISIEEFKPYFDFFESTKKTVYYNPVTKQLIK